MKCARRYFTPIIFLIVLLCLTTDVIASNRYVDSSAKGSTNGNSWADAWSSFSQITGLSAGDTVYISGGSKGSSKTYSVNTVTPIAGTPGNPISYKIGQVAGHNGTAVFTATGGAFVDKANVIVSGDAGDGVMHFIFSNDKRPLDNNGDNIRISYVNCGEKTRGFYNNGGTNIEIDNVYFKKLDSAGKDDRAMYLNLRGSTWNVNKIHHCTILIPYKGSGIGDDAIQGGSSGISIYNNKIMGYLDSGYSDNQHADGWQQLSGKYIKIYNNYFMDITNYAIFASAHYGNYAHLWIYNNVIALTSSAIQKSIPPQAIAIGTQVASYNNLGYWPNFDDVLVANNTITDYGGHKCLNINNSSSSVLGTFTNCVVANNICLNGGGFGIEKGITNNNNLKISDVSEEFLKYSPLSPSNNFSLTSSSIMFRNKGTNLSSYFTTDKDGNQRPKDGPWDIGAYQFNSGSASPSSFSDLYPPQGVRVIN